MKNYTTFIDERAKSVKRKKTSTKKPKKQKKQKKAHKSRMSMRKKLAVGAGALVAGGVVVKTFAKSHGRTIADLATYLG